MCGMDVAIKIMKAKKDTNKSNLKRLKKEYWMLKTLQHPHILRCLGYSKFKSKYCLILERCTNGSLNQYLNNHSLTLNQRLQLAYNLSGVIEYMHYKGICHYDIKPHNILLTEHLEPKLCDFGLSEMAEND
mmetsp:Transcript_29688/g.5347  ORF Transcript_29688/g.5347 Transcript_29688/m.5347 type:complete len:131 (+) Transcript_29688:317-709(+)